MTSQANNIKKKVQDVYGTLAEKRGGPEGDDGSSATVIDTGFASALYKNSDIEELPENVTNASLGCGNPTAISSLQQGEVVLDLGSGGGIDCFLASKEVGSSGHVIGVDMTEKMISLANENKEKVGAINVEFRKGEIENLPVSDSSIDVIISNCVINLSPDKDSVFHEAYRVLKPGGRLAISDIVSEGEIPQELLENVEAWVGCISGALDQSIYLDKIRQAGFSNVHVTSRRSFGIEDIPELDSVGREALKKDVDWSTIAKGTGIFSASIVAYK